GHGLYLPVEARVQGRGDEGDARLGGAVHVPDRDRARRALVTPHEVGLAVAVEVANAHDAPGEPGCGPRSDGRGADSRRTVHEPDRDNAGRTLVTPHEVGLAVTVEVANALDLPGDGDGTRGDERGARLHAVVHAPDGGLARGRAVTPYQVGLEVAVEVARDE